MRRFALVVALLPLIGSLGLGAPRASAEGFIDLYVTGAFTELNGVSLSDQIGGGLKGGAYFEGVPFVDLGFAIDLSYYQLQDFTISGSGGGSGVFRSSPLFALRVPLLKTDRMEHGMIQPYFMVGPGLFTTIVYGGGLNLGSDFEVGLDLRLGTKVMLLPFLGIFLEYGYNSVDPTVLGVKRQIRSNQVAGGIGFNF